MNKMEESGKEIDELWSSLEFDRPTETRCDSASSSTL